MPYPKRQEEMKRLNFVVTAEDEKRLREEAEQCNQKLSAYLRAVLAEREQPKAGSSKEARVLYADLDAVQKDLEAMIAGNKAITPEIILESIKQIRADSLGVKVG